MDTKKTLNSENIVFIDYYCIGILQIYYSDHSQINLPHQIISL